MRTVPIPFPGISSPNKQAETGGRLINAYIEKLDDGRTAYRAVPGLEQVSTSGTYLGCRGMIAVGTDLLVARGSRLTKITKSGSTYTETDLGALGGSGPVFFARNGKSPTPDIVAVSDSTAYLITTSSAPASYPDADVQSPNSVAGLGFYLIFSYGDGRMRATDLNSTSIATTDEATAESSPDSLLRVMEYGRDLLVFGSQSIEIWNNSAEATGFPLSYRDTIQVGLMSSTAVAGSEVGFIGKVIFVGSDGIVYALNGYQRERISTHAIERQIAALTTAQRATLRATVYIHSGHAVWALTCSEWTWAYDISTGSWHERKSYGADNWRGAYSAFIWDEWIIGDATTGQIYRLAEAYRFEGPNTPLVSEVQSAIMSPFPGRAQWVSVDLDIMGGVGLAAGANPIQTDPVARVLSSRDGGVTFDGGRSFPIGKQGDYGLKVKVNRLGHVSSAGAVVRVSVSDPVTFTLFGGNATFEALK